MYVVAVAFIDVADIVVDGGDDDVGDVTNVVDVADVRAAVVVDCDVVDAVDDVAISDVDVARGRFGPETQPSNALTQDERFSS